MWREINKIVYSHNGIKEIKPQKNEKTLSLNHEQAIQLANG